MMRATLCVALSCALCGCASALVPAVEVEASWGEHALHQGSNHAHHVTTHNVQRTWRWQVLLCWEVEQ